MDRWIIRNRARCKKCGDVIESRYGHDFVWCKCGAIAVDGGRNYLKRVGNIEDCEELSELYKSPPKDSIRTMEQKPPKERK